MKRLNYVINFILHSKKKNYYSFYTVSKTLNQNREGFYKCEKDCFIHSSLNSLISFTFQITFDKHLNEIQNV